MKIPKILKKNNRTYKLIKTYETYVLYEEVWFGYKECFMKHELGLIQRKEKTYNLKPEKVTFLQEVTNEQKRFKRL